LAEKFWKKKQAMFILKLFFNNYFLNYSKKSNVLKYLNFEIIHNRLSLSDHFKNHDYGNFSPFVYLETLLLTEFAQT